MFVIPLGVSAIPSGNASITWGDIKKGNSIEVRLAPPNSCITEAVLSQRIFGKVYTVTQRYLDPLPRATGCTGVHSGIDYSGPSIKGVIVKSATSGIVIKIEPNSGFVFVFDGSNTVIYGHMNVVLVDNVKKVCRYYINVKDKVTLGVTPLGAVDSKGISTGPHLHLEVRKGYSEFATSCDATKDEVERKNLNPISYIK